MKRVRTRKLPPNTKYVGRPTKWANPFKMGPDGTRDDVMRKYRPYAAAKVLAGELDPDELRGIDLACGCAPLPCHADFLLALANAGPGERGRLLAEGG